MKFAFVLNSKPGSRRDPEPARPCFRGRGLRREPDGPGSSPHARIPSCAHLGLRQTPTGASKLREIFQPACRPGPRVGRSCPTRGRDAGSRRAGTAQFLWPARGGLQPRDSHGRVVATGDSGDPGGRRRPEFCAALCVRSRLQMDRRPQRGPRGDLWGGGLCPTLCTRDRVQTDRKRRKMEKHCHTCHSKGPCVWECVSVQPLPRAGTLHAEAAGTPCPLPGPTGGGRSRTSAGHGQQLRDPGLGPG